MVAVQPLVSEFTFIGQLEEIIIKSENCIKQLYLATEQGKYWIKVTKELRNRLNDFHTQLQPGCSLKITGKREYQICKGKVKYKAYQIELVRNQVSYDEVKPKAKVLFCQKSTCWKKGGKAACEAMMAELSNRGMASQVKIQKTGCLKQCKKAPNMVVMPDKACYGKVEYKQVAQIIDKHLLSTKQNF
jgi:(2Fe-2S) ferredoxin